MFVLIENIYITIDNVNVSRRGSYTEGILDILKLINKKLYLC